MSNLIEFGEQLSVARLAALAGNCKKRNYGCAIFSPNGNLISYGYTHSANACKECARKREVSGHGYDKCPSIHAEQAALLNTIIIPGSTAFLVCFDAATGNEIIDPKPCHTCAKLLKEAGIREVITISEVITL